MKALSIMQPWAYLIIKGYKDIENRPWPTDYRGPLLIHASKRWSQEGFDFLSDRKNIWVPSKEQHIFGALVGMADLVDCVDSSDSPWFWGDWGFVLRNPREFKEPIPWRGNVELFDIPESVVGKIRLEGENARENH